MRRFALAKPGVEAVNPPVKLDGHSHVKARPSLCLIMDAFRWTVAMHYCLAAQRDEKNGSPFAAALQWRNAAELVGSSGPVAERCWMEWERIMQLPRRLAAPIV